MHVLALAIGPPDPHSGLAELVCRNRQSASELGKSELLRAPMTQFEGHFAGGLLHTPIRTNARLMIRITRRMPGANPALKIER
jgi:hypothetical protein